MNNNMNPQELFQLMSEIGRFKADHPKAVAFASSIARDGLKEGTVLELKVTSPTGEEKICNVRVNERDVAMIAMLKELGIKKN